MQECVQSQAPDARRIFGQQSHHSIKRAVSLWSGIVGLTLVALPLPAQESLNTPQAETSRASTIQNRSSGQLRISLTIRDRTVGDVIRQIANQAGKTIVYDNTNPQFQKKISVSLVNATLADAFKTALNSTNLTATVAPDGVTVMVHVAEQDASANGNKPSAQQQGELSGVVVDSTSRKGIAGVSVSIDGTRLTAMTGEGGRFTIPHVPAGEHTIQLRAVGYRSASRTIKIEAKERTTLTILLVATPTVLSDVVTTATGQQRRVEVGYDIATIRADSLLQTAPIRTVSDMLAVARVPGVTVESTSGIPGAPSRIRIRGIGSMLGDNDPAVYVDGVRISATSSGERMKSNVQSGTVVTSRLDDIDPQTIETIEVLRGPSASALYGSDAANGVIIITTKKGLTGPTRWDFRIAHDWNDVPGVYPSVATGWGHSVTSLSSVRCNIAQVIAKSCVQDSVSFFNPEADPLFRSEASGSTTVYSLTMNGGVRQLRYNVTASYSDELGPTKMSDLERVRFRNNDVRIEEWMRRPLGLNTTNLTSNVSLAPSDGLDLNVSLQFIHRNRAKNEARAPVDKTLRDTVVNTLTTSRYTEDVSRLVLGGRADWRRWSWLQSNATAGIDRGTIVEIETSEKFQCGDGQCLFPGRSRNEGRRNETNLSVAFGSTLRDLTPARFQRFLRLRPSVGLDVRRTIQDRLVIRVDSAVQQSDLTTRRVWAGNAHGSGDSVRSATAGIYADLSINLLERFYTSVGIRRDIGSAFQKNGFVNYPKLSTSWLISDESFFPKSLPINTLRLRVGVGLAGIQPAFGIEGGYMVMEAMVNGVIQPTLVPTIVANPSVKPERKLGIETGFDLEALDRRVSFRLTMARDNTTNALTNQVFPAGLVNTGQAVRYGNISRIENRTLEIGGDVIILDRKEITFTLSANGTTRSQRVKRLGDGFLQPLFTGTSERVVEGYPLGGRWEQPILGYRDVDGDGLLSALEIVRADSVVFIGWSQPRYQVTYGTALALFSRKISITTNLAQDIGLTQSVRGTGWGLESVQASFDDQMWDNGRSTGSGSNGFSQTYATLRLNSAGISAEIPPHLAKAIRARSLAVQLTGRNLALWSNYRGRDPSVNSNVGEARIDPGNLIPAPRRYSLAVRIGL